MRGFYVLWSIQSISKLGSIRTDLLALEKTGAALSAAVLTICSYALYGIVCLEIFNLYIVQIKDIAGIPIAFRAHGKECHLKTLLPEHFCVQGIEITDGNVVFCSSHRVSGKEEQMLTIILNQI